MEPQKYELNKSNEWIAFQDNKKFFPWSPYKERLYVEDIASTLSFICRYGGRIGVFYSVAQHCVLSCRFAQRYKLECLLHDAAESITGDFTSPIKRHMPEFKEMEQGIEKSIERRFSLDNSIEAHQYVKWVDLSMLATEVFSLINHDEFKAKLTHEPFDYCIRPWSPGKAKREFLKEYYKQRPEERPKGSFILRKWRGY